MKNLILLTIFTFSFLAWGAGTDQDKAKLEAPQVNLLKNPGLEAQKTFWTASGGSWSTSTTSPLVGSRSGSFDASAASQNLDSQLIAIPAGMIGRTCLAEILYVSDSLVSGELKLQVIDQSPATVAEIDLDPTSSAVARKAQINFTCPTSGSIKLRITSTADASSIKLDDMFLGSGRNDVFIENRITDPVSFTPVFTNFTLGNGTVSTAVWTREGKFMRLDLKVIIGSTSVMSANPSFLIPGGYSHDTTVGAGGGDTVAGTGAILDSGTTIFDLKPQVATNTSISFRALNASANSVSIGATSPHTWATGDTFQMSIKFPVVGWESSGPSEAITLETTGFLIKSAMSFGGGDFGIGTGTIAETSLSTGTGSLTNQIGSAKIACDSAAATGLTCSGSNETVGISVDAPTAGVYEVCSLVTHGQEVGSGGSIAVSWSLDKMVNGTNTAEIEGSRVVGSHKSTVTSTGFDYNSKQIEICEFYDLTAGENTFHLRRSQAATGTVSTNQLVGGTMHWQIKKLNQQMPTPVFTDLQNSLNQKPSIHEPNQIICAFRVLNSGGSPSIDDDGGCLASVTDTGTGDWNHVFNIGMFTETPKCFCDTNVGSYDIGCHIGATVTGSVQTVVTTPSTGGPTDSNVNVMCIGNK